VVRCWRQLGVSRPELVIASAALGDAQEMLTPALRKSTPTFCFRPAILAPMSTGGR
jgi:hypothetical protein